MAGYANEFDASARSVNIQGAKNASALASGVAGKVVDRTVYDLMQLAVLANLAFTTAAGASGDGVKVTVRVNHSDTLSGSALASPELLYEFETEIIVNANNAAHDAIVTVPVNLLKARRYVQATVVVAAGTGAPTVTPATAAITYQLFPRNGVPAGVYDSAGYAVANITV
jgi:hypothetical protein